MGTGYRVSNIVELFEIEVNCWDGTSITVSCSDSAMLHGGQLAVLGRRVSRSHWLLSEAA